MVELLLFMVAPGAVVGLVAGIMARHGLAAVVNRILAGAVGGGVLSFVAANTLDWSDGEPAQIYGIWALISAVGALLVLGLFRLVRGRPSTA
jgi:uncharacterized membrane protein YeaQ/YmgE (transglycosylase-associated protein family)